MAETPMPAWFAALDDADRAECVRELFTLGAGLLENLPPDHPGPLEAALTAWKATGEALSDPVAREVLTSPHEPSDFVEVGPPAPAADQWVVVLGTHLPYHASACWILRDEDTARRFAEFVTAEIDPAQVMRALDPAAELLNWRQGKDGDDG